MPGDDARRDAELIAALNAGDPSAFDPLYRRHREWVRHIAARYLPPGEDAEDVVQEVFLKFLRQFPGFRLTSKLTTYLYPLARHAALARARRWNVERRARSGYEPETTGRAGPTGSMPELHAALRELPEGQREVLLMRAVDDMTLEEISAALGIPTGTVKSRLHGAVRALRAAPRTRGYFTGPDPRWV